jgi:3-hydroxyisobutyrate dehydrogenase
MPERVAVLGTGIMGAPMARNLLKAGFLVRVWNRTPDKARVLATEGADLAETPADAVREAAFVITMLTDAAAILAVMGQAAESVPDGAVWSSRPAWTRTWSAWPGSRRTTGSRS